MRLLHIGRATSNDIVISDQTVSRQHAQLMIDDNGQVTLVDLNSANGTFVNGKRVTEPRRLDSTDIVKVGEYLLLWRNYLQASAQTPVNPATQTSASAPAPAYEQPAYDMPPAPAKQLPWKWIGLGAAAVVLIVVLIVIFSGGSSARPLDGRWHEKGETDNWIEFGPKGKYTEGYKNAVTYDSATWKAMGVDRILIEKGKLEISRNYKFEGDDLKITQAGRPTVYQKEE
jgi:pSer/pThr/pTyr-binding forkhead associated (FHA) protein